MEDAAARKARLKALRAAAEAQAPAATQPEATQPEQSAVAQSEDQAKPEEPQLKFRNYTVKNSKRVAHDQVSPAQPPELSAPVVEPPAEQNEVCLFG